ncbi:hypothetical protein OG711_25310 [Streptomyces uncialis]|uniref:hypothetical protein n=1 Tax=Streptomyces uncialis TaxID=1048205 RepID=UPI002E2F967F|nr:hypothetical protein [Streptomyces uncialis]
MSTLADLSAPLRALRLICADHPDLPAPNLDVCPIYPERLHLSFHSMSDTVPSLAAFEVWRAALGVPDSTVDGHFQSDGRTWVLKARGEYAGATVELTAYADVPPVPAPVMRGAV